MESFQIQVTPSLLHNNLITSGRSLAYVSNVKPNPQIVLISADSLSSGKLQTSQVKYKSEEEILSLNYVNLRGQYYLILGFYQSLQIWNEEGSRMLGHISKDDIISADSETYFIGSCAVDSLQSIAIGCSKGCISIVSDNAEQQFSIKSTYFSRVQEPVACICAHESKILAFHENGKGTFFDLARNGEVRVVDGPNVTATVSTIVKKYGIVAFGSGEVRIYNMRDESLLAVVWAHTRWITAICRHDSRPIFVTCSEDCTYSAWALRNRKVEMVCSKDLPHTLLTGVCFVGERVMLVGYDKPKLMAETLV